MHIDERVESLTILSQEGRVEYSNPDDGQERIACFLSALFLYLMYSILR